MEIGFNSIREMRNLRHRVERLEEENMAIRIQLGEQLRIIQALSKRLEHAERLPIQKPTVSIENYVVAQHCEDDFSWAATRKTTLDWPGVL